MFGRKRIEQRLDTISHQLVRIIYAQEAQVSALTDLQAQVQHTTDVEMSAIVLIEGIAAQLAAAIAANDPAALTALQTQLASSADALAAAVTANTAAAPTT